MAIIYRAYNINNGKSYIGQTVKSLASRKASHKDASKRYNYLFYKAINKHGWNSFKWGKIAETNNQDWLNKLEELYINDYGDYNIKRFSQGKGKHSQETIKKIRESNKGKKRSSITRKKISNAQKNKKLSDNHKKAISEAQKKRRKLNPNLPIPSRPVVAIQATNENTSILFKSIKEAVLAGYCSSSIFRCLKGERKTHKNLTWSRL